jgi:hypothetical protein
VAIYNARIYNVVHKLPIMSRACIHFESHNPHVLIGDYHESIMISKALVKLEMEKNPKTTTWVKSWSKELGAPR